MAFNFNWSPLAADELFYSRARDLLTKALNKSPKPPIIVDDILVDELNLGTVPPDLEILEIGDLAEDRFRGIFKMCYSGDAYLTLKTRVQVRFASFCFCLLCVLAMASSLVKPAIAETSFSPQAVVASHTYPAASILPLHIRILAATFLPNNIRASASFSVRTLPPPCVRPCTPPTGCRAVACPPPYIRLHTPSC